MKTYKFNGDNIHIIKEAYQNGRVCLTFIDAENGDDYLVATTNIPEMPLAKREVIIKTWSENEGVLEFLIDHKIVSDTKRFCIVGAGFAHAHVVELRRPISIWLRRLHHQLLLLWQRKHARRPAANQ